MNREDDWISAAALESVTLLLIEFLVVNMSIHQGHPDKYSAIEEKVKQTCVAFGQKNVDLTSKVLSINAINLKESNTFMPLEQ